MRIPWGQRMMVRRWSGGEVPYAPSHSHPHRHFHLRHRAASGPDTGVGEVLQDV